jgi:hypothetical protein
LDNDFFEFSKYRRSQLDTIALQHLPPQQAETKTDKLKEELGKYGFFELPKVKQLSEPNKQRLIEMISRKMRNLEKVWNAINLGLYTTK